MKIALIVAKYKEDISWIHAVPEYVDIYVYHKHPHSQQNTSRIFHSELPNVGRESHTYLHHIIQHYETLDQYDGYIFVQGFPFDHIGNMHNIRGWIDTWTREIVTYGSSQNMSQRDYWASFDWTIDEYKGPIRLCEMKLGPWCEEYVVKPYPTPLLWYVGANFGVATNLIKKRSKESYTRLIETVSGHASPAECHYMERLWCYICHCIPFETINSV